MWIKEKPEMLGESGPVKANFLYKSGKIYIMDNHLCASWCWLQEIDTDKRYNYLHIDRHYDLCESPDEVKSVVIDHGIDVSKLSFNEYENLSYEFRGMRAKLFRWDTYILNLQQLYPELFASTVFITKRAGASTDFVEDEYELEQFLGEYRHWLRIQKMDGVSILTLITFLHP